MTDFKYGKHIIAVEYGLETIGYRCRRSVIYGYAQDIPDYWIVTTNLRNPEWSRPFRRLGDADKHLLTIFKMERAARVARWEATRGKQLTDLH